MLANDFFKTSFCGLSLSLYIYIMIVTRDAVLGIMSGDRSYLTWKRTAQKIPSPGQLCPPKALRRGTQHPGLLEGTADQFCTRWAGWWFTIHVPSRKMWLWYWLNIRLVFRRLEIETASVFFFFFFRGMISIAWYQPRHPGSSEVHHCGDIN